MWRQSSQQQTSLCSEGNEGTQCGCIEAVPTLISKPKACSIFIPSGSHEFDLSRSIIISVDLRLLQQWRHVE